MAVRFAGASGGCGAVLRKTIGMRSAIGLRHPASASCLGRHLRLAGRCPNNSSLFPPLAAVVVVVLCAYSAEKLLIIEQCRAVCGPPGIAFSRVGSWRKTAALGIAGSPSQSMPIGLDSSPKGRAFGSPRKFHLFAKASPFDRLPPTGGRCRLRDRKGNEVSPKVTERARPLRKSAGGTERTLSVIAARCHLPRKGEVLLCLPPDHEKLPLRGELATTSGSRLRGSSPLTSPLFCTIILQK